jgi:cobalt-zinc-cadmium efflux system membrane fusion protein
VRAKVNQPGSIEAAAAAAALACALLAGCSKSSSSEQATKAEPAKGQRGEPAALVREGDRIRVPDSSPMRGRLEVAAAEEVEVEEPIVAPAVVEADPAKLMKVLTPVSGRITRIYKQLGDSVQPGEALFAVDSADLAQAYSDANKARATLALAARNLERQQRLAKEDIAALKELQQAENDHAQAVAEDARARARLEQLGVEPVRQGSGREYLLRSPIGGRVIELVAAQGGYWTDTTAPIMTVADLSSVYLSAAVPENDLAAVFVGQAAKVVLNAYPHETHSGKVRYVAEVLDPDTRTVKARIAAGNAQGHLRPGMFGRVTLSGRAHKAPVVPVSALIQGGFTTRVFVEIAPWTFQSREVKTGAQLGKRIEIVSGLKAGERIVVQNGLLLND